MKYVKSILHNYSFGAIKLERKEWEKLVENLIREGILRSPKVIKAMRSVPRTKFLPENMQSYSAVDTPLPIGFGQTISAPHSLAFAG
jgi:protein-L-isoaspartate(D-aspartate) O-methyltransferase